MRQSQQLLLQDMDVTFTNVLEGARQYFQGLPAAPETATVGPSTVRGNGGYGPLASSSPAAAATTSRAEAQCEMPPHPAYVQAAPNNLRIENEDPNTHPNYNMQQQAYWMQHTQEHSDSTKELANNKSHERLQELPTMDMQSVSAQQEQRLPCRTSQPSHSQDTSKVIQNYHYQQSQNPSSQTYQYARMHSMENSANSLHYSNQYSHMSHQTANMHTANLQPNNHQSRSSSRSQEQIATSKVQCYQQLQTSKQHVVPSPHSENMYINGYPQNQSYYPPHSKPQSPAAPPPNSQANYLQPSSNQTHNQYASQSYVTHSQSPLQSQTQYLSTKPVSQNEVYDNANKTDMSGMHMVHMSNSQHRRTTHNLPPIASLSTVNYHSNKGNRETVQRIGGTVQRHRSQSGSYISGISVPTNNAAPVASVPSTIYSNSQQHTRPAVYSQQSNHCRSNSYTAVVHNQSNMQTNRYTGSNNSEHQYQLPAVSSPAYTCTSVNNASSSSSSSKQMYPQSSYPQYFHKLSKVPGSQESAVQKHNLVHQTKEVHPQTTNRLPNEQMSIASNQPQRNELTNILQESMNPKQKRESPLDLSVKTVRTSADSTALDESEAHSSEAQRYAKAYSKTVRVDTKHPGYHTVQTPSNGSYTLKDNHGINQQRNLIRSTNIPSSGAPKVDFLPNFSVSALHTSQQNLQNPQQNHQNQQSSNTHQASYQQYKPNDPNHMQNVMNQNKLQRNVSHEEAYYHRQNSYQIPVANQHNNNNMRPNTSVGNNTYHMTQTNDNKMMEPLPRFDFPIEGSGYKKSPVSYPSNVRDANRKRSTESPSSVPNKITKVDNWRQTIDQQIEQRLSSYANSRLQQEQQKSQANNNNNTQFIKPNTSSINMNQNKLSGYAGNQTAYYPQQNTQGFHNNQYNIESQSSNHVHTYVPEVNQQHYQTNVSSNQTQSQYDMYVQNSLHRSNSASKLHGPVPPRGNNIGGAADKRILSILRNSLEIKGAKEAQKKLDQAVKPMNVPTNPVAQTGIQHPSTDVTAPLQPKPSIHSRHNVSPFTASSLLERNSNTPPNYKFHFPRAVDSVKFESDTVIKDEVIQKDNMHTYPPEDTNITATNNCNIPPMGANTGTTDLDGLAAFLAARIRTKAERKQTEEPLPPRPVQDISNNSLTDNKLTPTTAINSSGTSSSGGSPPKLSREQNIIPPPRRKLFSKTEEDPNTTTVANGNSSVPLRNTTLRSSSETSVFDFRDSDSEGEMPVLERQSLEDMRRDRKSQIKLQQTPLIINSPEAINEENTLDLDWADACDKFVEQLQTTAGKKRGRRKKVVEADVLAKLETVTKENPLPEVTNLDVVKKEIEDEESKTEMECSEIKEIKQEPPEEPPNKSVDGDSDSDVPLNSIKCTAVKEENISEDEEVSLLSTKQDKIGAKTKIEYSSESESDNDISEKLDMVTRKLFSKKSKKSDDESEKPTKKMVLRSADSSPVKKTCSYLKKKAIYGDGSDFHPGWEEEVYSYKRSIRMPASLISVPRPHWHRMSTSLPDLDACSPTPSSLTDDIEFLASQRKSLNSSIESMNLSRIKKDLLDSDIDSNSSFSFSHKAIYDSEEASCSSVKTVSKKPDSTTKKETTSILDVLVERYSKQGNRKSKQKDKKNGPKIIQKSSNPLLATPSLGIGSPDIKEKPKKGRAKVKKEKEKEKEDAMELNNSVYLGFFRKETVNTFRDTFKKNSSGFMGMGEAFSPIVFKSRTRTETKVMKQRATIKEVFGEDRPASAPPTTCREEDLNCSSEKSPEKSSTEKTMSKERKIDSIKASLRSANSPVKKLYHIKKKNSLVKNVTQEVVEEQSVVKSETPSVNSDETSDVTSLPTKKRLKLTKMRRKFSSGFDYIRKKKKIIKKESDVDSAVKPKRRSIVPRQNPESEQDIQKEIKTWVMNKGVGETHLHRAARLGYTDITAYCLEKLECNPSPKDNAGYTPLHEACSRGHLDIARLLLLYGANVSESAQGGIRPLHEAAENGFVEIMRLLLAYGADPKLATYSGLTPLALATDEETKYVLKNYIADMDGLPAPPWIFNGPAAFFDNENSGYNPLNEAPSPEPESDAEDVDIEISEAPLPNFYTLRDEPLSEKWILLQDLSILLKIKSRDTLLRQISPTPAASSSGTPVNKSLIREMKFNEFMEKAHCCTLLCANEKLNVRSSKIALVKYTDKVKKLLGVEKFTIPSR